MSDTCSLPPSYASSQQTPPNNSEKKVQKTVRIVVRLPPSNEDTCPEYNYKDELEAAVKNKRCSKVPENGDIYDDPLDDESVRRIAMRMEEKYGKGTTTKKRRKGRKDDFADIGMGYDESDSFIDNTDGYDEIIPQNVTTLHGGFYINCGALVFKAEAGDEEDEDEDDDEETRGSSHSRSDNSPVKNGKRSLESDLSEDERSDKRVKTSGSDNDGPNGMRPPKKKKMFDANKPSKKDKEKVAAAPPPPPPNVLKKTVKDLLKEKRKDLNMSVDQRIQGVDSPSDNPASKEGLKVTMENGKNLSTSINDAIESVVKAFDEPILAKCLSSRSNVEMEPIQLPENLPGNISDTITKIKTTCSNVKGNQFTDEMNSLLLSLEKKCKCLGKPSKMKVYKHLAFFLKVEKNILMNHCNQLALKDDERKIKSSLLKLKLEIDKLMPSIVTNYEKECDLVLEKRTLLQQQNSDNEEKRKSIGRPKRKFQWNDITRKHLKDAVAMKKRSHLQQGKTKESWEEESNVFLKNQVLHLWPEGWMTMTTLTKVCNKLFNEPHGSHSTKTDAIAQTSQKKEHHPKITASAPILPYPNVTITPVTCSSSPASLPNADRRSNGTMGTFLKIDYDKTSTSSSINKQYPITSDDQKHGTVIEVGRGDILSRLPKLEQDKANNKKEDEQHRTVVGDFDDIQKVMERLRNLQKMSSPVKIETSSSSSNHGVAMAAPTTASSKKCPKTSNVVDPGSSFQDEFQRQFLYSNVLGNLGANASKSNYKCS